MTIDPKDIVGFAIERAAAPTIYWNILIVVIGVVLGLLQSGKLDLRDKYPRVVLTAGFALFAYSNLLAICETNSQRSALCNLVGDPVLRGLVATLRPPATWQVIAFHVIIDTAVVLMIWAVDWGRRGGQRKTAMATS